MVASVGARLKISMSIVKTHLRRVKGNNNDAGTRVHRALLILLKLSAPARECAL